MPELIAGGPTIPVRLLNELRRDEFQAFSDIRMRALSAIVADPIGKPVVVEAGTDNTERDVEFAEDEIAEREAAA
ncbi:MAG: hypothetical protein OXF88_18035 [Rhodobacteraceae bacterium]|nr:hypothetical protein [Paracoccaceae bacterium]MCY4136763.1 hypothetical protein [Paracoccaceae bacterium]